MMLMNEFSKIFKVSVSFTLFPVSIRFLALRSSLPGHCD